MDNHFQYLRVAYVNTRKFSLLIFECSWLWFHGSRLEEKRHSFVPTFGVLERWFFSVKYRMFDVFTYPTFPFEKQQYLTFRAKLCWRGFVLCLVLCSKLFKHWSNWSTSGFLINIGQWSIWITLCLLKLPQQSRCSIQIHFRLTEDRKPASLKHQ